MCEESARFGDSTLGSKAMRGALTVQDLHRLTDKQGTSLYEVLKGRSLHPDEIEQVEYKRPVKSFTEIHIEQGKVPVSYTHLHEYGSITLQSGERCDDAFVDYVVDLIRDIKAIGDGSLGITMCVGEQSEEAYRRMREAGASRYLLRIETTNKELYHKIHPQDELHSFETRVEDVYKRQAYMVVQL